MPQLSRAKEQTEAAQTRLMEAIESISEGFIHCDSNDRLVLCNRKFLEFWPGIAGRGAAGHAVRRHLPLDGGERAGRQSRSRAGSLVERRLRLHRDPGEPIVVHLRSGRWLQIRERLTRDGGIVGIYTDISEVKVSEERRRERELAEKSVLLQSTLDNLMQGVSVFDSDLRLVAWNDQFVDLLELPDWLVEQGTPLTEYLQFRGERGDYGGDGAAAAAVRLEAARQRRPLQDDQVLPSGRMLEVRRDPMPDGGFVTTYTDITERKESAEALREAKESLERRVAERTAELTELNAKLRQEIFERAKIEEALRVAKAEAEVANLSKTKFLAAASHDLLQPLNAARLFVAALLERPLGEKESEFADRIDGALKSVEALLATLLDISKFDAGAVNVDRVEFDIADVLASLEQEYAPTGREAGLDFRFVACSAVVLSDPALLTRIVRNLVSNAIRYTAAGRVLLGCRRRGRMLRIEVWDTGLGIPEANIVGNLSGIPPARQSAGPRERRRSRPGDRPAHRKDPGPSRHRALKGQLRLGFRRRGSPWARRGDTQTARPVDRGRGEQSRRRPRRRHRERRGSQRRHAGSARGLGLRRHDRVRRRRSAGEVRRDAAGSRPADRRLPPGGGAHRRRGHRQDAGCRRSHHPGHHDHRRS